jgi:hypothetical protein
MKLSKENFHIEAFTEFPTYVSDNSWFGFKLEKDDPKGPKQSIAMSWLAYEKTTGATAGALILGDTKLRSDEALVSNFGLSSAGGVQEEESLRMVEDIMNRRQAIATGAPFPDSWDPMIAATGAMDQMSPSPMAPMSPPSLVRPTSSMTPMRPTTSMRPTSSLSSAPPGAWDPSMTATGSMGPMAPSPMRPMTAVPVVGSGSILSTRGWSPMLNDAFIMGGVHSGHQFHVALNNDESGLFDRTKNAGLSTRDNWRLFFRANPRSLWDSERGVPRVLMREFICLKASGYAPNFDREQLIFGNKKDGAADKAVFRVYLTALHELGFQRASESKDKLAKAVSEFLFEDGDALKGAF